MTELMMRLLKDGKIVGYEWHRLAADDATAISVWYSIDMQLWFYSGGMDENVLYDSFELGTKIMDKWFFEGDLVRAKLDEIGRIIWDGFRFIVEWNKDDEKYTELRKAPRYTEVIGNIHE